MCVGWETCQDANKTNKMFVLASILYYTWHSCTRKACSFDSCYLLMLKPISWKLDPQKIFITLEMLMGSIVLWDKKATIFDHKQHSRFEKKYQRDRLTTVMADTRKGILIQIAKNWLAFLHPFISMPNLLSCLFSNRKAFFNDLGKYLHKCLEIL